MKLSRLIQMVVLLLLSTPTQAIVLDDYSSDANFLAGKYTHYPVYLKPQVEPDGPLTGSVVVSDGTLKIETQNVDGLTLPGTSAHMWNGGETMQQAGNMVSLDIVANVYTQATSAGLYLDSDLAGPEGGNEIRMYHPSDDTLRFVGPWGSTMIDVSGVLTKRPFLANPSFFPQDRFEVTIAAEVLSTDNTHLYLRGTLSSSVFGTVTEDFTIEAQKVYFGPVSYWNRSDTLQSTYIHEVDNLTFTTTCNPGDTDGDGDIDTGDLTTAIGNYTGPTGSGKSCEDGDTDFDGDVDANDLTNSIINFTGALAGNPNVPDLIYDPATGNVTIDADGADVISFSLQSGPFNAADFSELPAGLTDNIATQIGWTSFNLFSGLTGAAELGGILPAGLDEAQLAAALSTATYGLALSTGGGGGTFDLIIPEPTSLLLLGLGALIVGRRRSVL